MCKVCDEMLDRVHSAAVTDNVAADTALKLAHAAQILDSINKGAEASVLAKAAVDYFQAPKDLPHDDGVAAEVAQRAQANERTSGEVGDAGRAPGWYINPTTGELFINETKLGELTIAELPDRGKVALMKRRA